MTASDLMTAAVAQAGLVPLVSDPVRQRYGRPVPPTTVRTHAVRGALTPDGRRVRLATIRQGGRLFTTLKAVDEFLRATGGAVTVI